MRRTLNIVGENFAHAPGSCLDKVPEHVQWDYTLKSDGSTMHLDFHMLADPLPGPAPHWGWMLETPAKTNRLVSLIPYLVDRFERIYTYNTRLAERHHTVHWAPASGIWIKDKAVHLKSKICSMVVSPKASLPGHRLRLAWAYMLDNLSCVDVFGLNSRIETKEEGLCDYMFSVAMENARAPGYFTEKVLDCFATGTVPVYYGAPDIGDFFNTDGIIMMNESFDPRELTLKRYLSMLSAVEDNFKRCLQYEIPEDWMAETYGW